MVKLLNLDEDADPEGPPIHPPPTSATGNEEARPNLNVNQVSAAFVCYP